MSSFGGQVAMAQVAERLPDFAASQGPDAGEGQWAARAEADKEWRFPAPVFPPLVEAVGDDEAAMTSEGVSEHRFRGVDRTREGQRVAFGFAAGVGIATNVA
jgi:hypothetical protein